MLKDDPKGSYIRWQSITIGQLTYAINLILSFSVATLGFQVTLLLNEKFMLFSWQKYVFFISLILLVISVTFGIFVVINRLRDFRVTTKVARKREEGTCEEEIEPYRVLYRRLGVNTWHLFWWQAGTFIFGALCTVLSVVLAII